ncbi:MAG: hypothetical protein M1835_000789 [Candelina submexicana]|nr:MAG: hypothetical protein M1835_000789 [Candelina submexicana]
MSTSMCRSTSTSFPSAHVFPGGNLSPEQDGQIPEVDDPLRHEDGPAYRLGAIRECFEESGILLARRKESAAHTLLKVEADVREEGRKAVHCNSIRLLEWLEQLGGVADTENLIPFTRWITPSNITRRFTTQMYIYFLPLATAYNAHSPSLSSLSDAQGAVIPSPTPDGGLEHTAARFLPPLKWLSMARRGEIVLFPPQYFLLHLISQLLSSEEAPRNIDRDELKRQRDALMEFLERGDPPWGDKCICPFSLLGKREDGRTALSLERPGLGLESVGRRGDSERVVLVRFSEEGPRDLEVAWKIDVLEQDERMKGKL